MVRPADARGTPHRPLAAALLAGPALIDGCAGRVLRRDPLVSPRQPRAVSPPTAPKIRRANLVRSPNTGPNRTSALPGRQKPGPNLSYFESRCGQQIGLYTLRATNVTINSHADLLAHQAIMDKTTWLHHPATGLMTNKVHADGHGPTYTYTTDGKLHTRTWARGIVTRYGYAPGTRELLTTDYSDVTPSVTNTYNLLGQRVQVLDAAGRKTYVYDPRFQLVTEAWTGLVTNTLHRTWDSKGRTTGYSTTSGQTVIYGYHGDGRFGSVKSIIDAQTNLVTYGYLPGSDLVHTKTHDNGLVSRTSYEPRRNLITEVAHSHNNTNLLKFAYENDPGGRRIRRLDTEADGTVTTNLFDYNHRSEVTYALMGTNLSTYAYDPIGNRTHATQLDGTHIYHANELNQYTNITTVGMGPQLILHDLDGNLSDDGEFSYHWNGENRLTTLTNTSGTATNISFIYDSMGRRVRKQTILSDATDHVGFVYDDWNIIQTVGTSTEALLWGLDIFGTLQSAGGVGGLLRADDLIPHSDAIGNIELYSGNTLHTRSYLDSFGNELLHGESGGRPKFSSKFSTADPSITYFGFRYLQRPLGRWASREPVNVAGGVNLYAYLENNPVNDVDLLGNISADEVFKKWNEYLSLYPNMSDQIDKAEWGQEPFKKRCNVGITCRRCDPTISGKLTRTGTSSNGAEEYLIVVCSHAEQEGIEETLTEELTHFFDRCSGIGEECRKLRDFPKMHTCVCLANLINEMRAKRVRGLCSHAQSCWRVVERQGYPAAFHACRKAMKAAIEVQGRPFDEHLMKEIAIQRYHEAGLLFPEEAK